MTRALFVTTLFIVCCTMDAPSPPENEEETLGAPEEVGLGVACAQTSEDTQEACSDGCSNDGDRYVDCDDFDCAGIGACPGPNLCPGELTSENTETACSDGCSNDGDRYVDCNDFDCAGVGTCPVRAQNDTPPAIQW